MWFDLECTINKYQENVSWRLGFKGSDVGGKGSLKGNANVPQFMQNEA